MTHAFGVIGLNPDDFWDLTWYEWYLISEGYEIKSQKEWDHTRNLLMTIYNASPKVKHPVRSADKVMRLPKVDDLNYEILSVQQDSDYEEFQKVIQERSLQINGSHRDS